MFSCLQYNTKILKFLVIILKCEEIYFSQLNRLVTTMNLNIVHHPHHYLCLLQLLQLRSWSTVPQPTHSGPASQEQNTVHLIWLHLQFIPLHSEFSHPHLTISSISSGATVVPSVTVRGFKTNPSCSQPKSVGRNGDRIPAILFSQSAT